MSVPMRVLLFASLAFNLLVIGGAVGAGFAGVRLERPGEASAAANEAAPQAQRMPGPRAIMAALPQPTRMKLRQAMAQTWSTSANLRDAARQARLDALNVAAQEPYDIERVRAAFARVREADVAALAPFHDSVAQTLGQLTPEERRQAIEAIRNAAPAAGQGNRERPIGPFRERLRRRFGLDQPQQQ